MPLPRWLFTHSASFCIGGTVSAVVAVWLQSSHHHDKVVGDGSYNDSTSSFAVGNIVNKGCAVGLPIHTYHPNNNLTIACRPRCNQKKLSRFCWFVVKFSADINCKRAL